MSSDYSKAPRLYVPDDLSVGVTAQLSRDHAHYLINVMRKNDGDIIRIFNGIDGEFIGKLSILNKKSVELKWLEKMKEQPGSGYKINLYVAPIKKDRMAFAVEKAVELGVTDIHPIITDFTQHGKINRDKVEKQIIEALEQCERLSVPTLHSVKKLKQINFIAPTYAAIERDGDVPIFQCEHTSDIGLLIGPEGGWSDNERDFIHANKNLTPVSLGDNILRAETATIFMLSRIY